MASRPPPRLPEREDGVPVVGAAPDEVPVAGAVVVPGGARVRARVPPVVARGRTHGVALAASPAEAPGTASRGREMPGEEVSAVAPGEVHPVSRASRAPVMEASGAAPVEERRVSHASSGTIGAAVASGADVTAPAVVTGAPPVVPRMDAGAAARSSNVAGPPRAQTQRPPPAAPAVERRQVAPRTSAGGSVQVAAAKDAGAAGRRSPSFPVDRPRATAERRLRDPAGARHSGGRTPACTSGGRAGRV